MFRKLFVQKRKRRMQLKNRLTHEMAHKHCVPCEGGIPALKPDEIKKLQNQLEKGWNVENNKKIVKYYNLVNYRHTIDLVNKIAALAEAEGHHPVLHVYYARLEVELYTFSIDGLSENDFILAAKIDGQVV